MLQHWQGQPGCVQLLEADLVNGIMLMERVIPGQTFRQAVAADRSMADVAHDSAAIQAVLNQRVDKLAGRFSRECLLPAGYLDLVLSVCWTLNGGSPLRPQTRLLLESYARLF